MFTFWTAPWALKLLARTGSSANMSVPRKNIGENGFRRQNWMFFTSNWWREWISSSKLTVSHLKLVTRMSLVVKIKRSLPQIGDENESRRQNWMFSTSKWRRERVSSSKLSVPCLKLVTRTSLVVKIDRFTPKIGDENESRRQNWMFSTSKWRRERVSSSKLSVPCLKLVTRTSLVVKIDRFTPKIGDENESRRQKIAFLTPKWWREWISSSKNSITHPKMVTRTNLVVKIDHYSPQNGDENESRRQNWPFPT